MVQSNDAQTLVLILQTVVLAITALLIFWYSYETRRLRKIQQRPFVIVQSLGTSSFNLTNIGNSSALNVRVAGISISAEDALHGETGAADRLRSARFIPHLKAGDPTEIMAQRFRREVTSTQSSHAFGEANFADSSLVMLRVDFEDVEMQSYFVEQMVQFNALKIMRSKKHRLFSRGTFLRIQTSAHGQIEDAKLTRKGLNRIIKPVRP